MIPVDGYLAFAANGVNAALIFAAVVAIIWSSTEGRGPR